MDDPYRLNRFVDAQDPVLDRVLRELRGGRKTSHWMWFIFPQIAGLGLSDMSRRFAISGRAEAEAYLDHPVLSSRLIDCTAAAMTETGSDAVQVFGDVDAAKLRSCLTLFAEVTEEDAIFQTALDRFFDGGKCARTLATLAGARG